MAAFNFPASPSNGDTYTLNSVTYQWDGTKWVRYSAAVGSQGGTGSTGAQGAQGAQGHQGLQGAQAHISTSAPSSGVNNGDLWWESDTGDLAIYYNDGNSSQWIDINTGPRGAQGGTGPTGAQGATAAAGAQGAAGAAGAQGATGSTGAQGATGSTGAQGASGSGGSTGAQGATGSTGAQGATGSQGAAGAQGDDASLTTSTSAPGSPSAGDLWWDSDDANLYVYYNDGSSSQWVTVNTGVRGAQGATGSTGAQGATGSTGAQGATGSAGSSASISNNSDNRVITGGSGTNLNAESALTFDGNNLTQTIDASQEGFKLYSSTDLYPTIEANVNRSNNGDHLLELLGKWNNSTVCKLALMAGDDTTNKDNGQVCFFTSAASGSMTKHLTLDENGDLCLGTDASSGKLTVDSGTSNTCATFQSSDAGAGINVKDNHARSSIEQNGTTLKISSDTGGEYANSDIRFQIDGASRATLTSTGNFGINDTSPTSQLVVKATTDDNPAISFYRQSTGGDVAALIWKTGAGNQAMINYRGGGGNEGLQFYTNGTSTIRARIDTSGNFLPGATNTYNLGSSSLLWNNIYTNDLHLTNKGGSNDVDGTWGNYTIQEGESDLYLINNRSGKKYKFLLQEVN